MKKSIDGSESAMRKAFENIWSLYQEYNDTSMREAAYMYSIKVVADAMSLEAGTNKSS